MDRKGIGVEIDQAAVAGHPEAAFFIFKNSVKGGVDDSLCRAKYGYAAAIAFPAQQALAPRGYPGYAVGFLQNIGDAILSQFREGLFDALVGIEQVQALVGADPDTFFVLR